MWMCSSFLKLVELVLQHMDYLKGLDPGSQVNYKDILVTNGKM